MKNIKKELTIEEKAKALNAEMQQALELEQKEVSDYIANYLQKKGYSITAKVVMEMGKEVQIIPYVFKVK
jgi:hypothetical protein